MDKVEKQKLKLQQKKNRIAAEEIRLNLQERKMRTRHLIEVGGLVAKAELDHLPLNTLYGAMISLKNIVNKNSDILKEWTQLGKEELDRVEKTKQAVILKLDDKPTIEIRNHIRLHRLKWNRVREEWYVFVTDINTLKEGIGSVKYSLEII